MRDVTVEGLTKRFGGGKSATTAVDDVNLRIEEGEFLVLLGPSGCGKTTTLRCLAGLERPTEGSIQFGDTTVYSSSQHIDTPPNERSVGMVFQSFALWPHLTVRKNISYPLRVRRMRSELASGWVDEVARIVDCHDLMERLPSQLSGGQQQRVALARAIAAQPNVILFDEPLSNLDAKLRREVRTELHQLHAKLGFTAVFVTHDQSEAMSLGDRLVVMRRGRVEQVGEPKSVRNSPASEYVADFMGMENRLDVYRDGQNYRAAGQPLKGNLAAAWPGQSEMAALRLRPGDLRLAASTDQLDGICSMAAEVVDVAFGGSYMDVMVEANGRTLHAELSADDPYAATVAMGDRVRVGFDPVAARVYPISAPEEASGASPTALG